MLLGLPVFKGCVSGQVGEYSFYVHIGITGTSDTLIFNSDETFREEEKCEEAMRKSFKLIAESLSRQIPEIMIDPSKYIDVDERLPHTYTKQELH